MLLCFFKTLLALHNISTVKKLSITHSHIYVFTVVLLSTTHQCQHCSYFQRACQLRQFWCIFMPMAWPFWTVGDKKIKRWWKQISHIHVISNDICCIAPWVWNFQGGSRWSMWKMLRARNNHVSHILRKYILCTSYESEIHCKEETKRTSWQMVCWRQPSFLLSLKTVSHSPGGETLLCVLNQHFFLQDCANLYLLSSWVICAKNKIELLCPAHITRSGKLRWRALTVNTYIPPL